MNENDHCRCGSLATRECACGVPCCDVHECANATLDAEKTTWKMAIDSQGKGE